MADGRIIIDTLIDDSGANRGARRLKNRLEELKNAYKRNGYSANEAFRRAWQDINSSNENGTNRLIGNIQSTHSRASTILGSAVLATGAALTSIAGFAFKTGVSFEDAFANANKTISTTPQKMEELKNGIISMSEHMPESANEISQVVAAAGQLGIKTDNILGFSKVMVELGDSTDMSSTQAADSLARLANVVQMPQSQFDRLGASLLNVGNNLATTEGETTAMAMRIAGTGHQIGMTVPEILGFSGALSAVGIQAEEGGSSFSTLMSNMQLAVNKGGTSLQQFAQVAGMSSDQFKKAWQKDAASAIIAFITGLGNMKKQGKSAISVLTDMGIKNVRLRDTLLRASGAGDLFTRALGIANQGWTQNIALTREVSHRYETTANKLKMLKNSITALGIEIYEKFATPMKGAIDIALKNVSALSQALSSGQLSNSLAQIGQGLGSLISVISSLVRVILPPLITILGIVSTHAGLFAAAIVGVVTAMKTFKIVTSIISTIQGLQKAWESAKLAVEAYKSMETALAVTQNFTTVELTAKETLVGLLTGKIKLATVAQRLWNIAMSTNPIGLIITAIVTLIAVFGALWITSSSFRNFWINLWQDAKKACSKAIEGIKVIFTNLENFFTNTLPNAFKSTINFLRQDWKEILLLLVNPIAGGFALIYKHNATFRTSVNNFIANVKGIIKNGTNSTISTFQSFGNKVTNFFTKTVPKWISIVNNNFTNLPYKLGYALGFTIQKFKTWGTQSYNYFKTNIPIWINLITNYFKTLPSRVWNSLLNTINKTKSWGSTMKNQATTTSKNFVNNITSFLSRLPSRIWSYLVSSINRVTNWGNRMRSQALSTGRSFVSYITNSIVELPGRISNTLSNALYRVINWGYSLISAGRNAASELVNAIINGVESLPSQMEQIGENIVRGVWNGITSMGSWFQSQISSFFSGMVDGAKAALGIHSPSRVMRDEVGKWILPGIKVGIDETMPNLQDNLKDKMLNLTKKMRASVQLHSANLGASMISKNILISNKNDDEIPKPVVINVENKNYLDSKEIAGHTTKKVIENISDMQRNYNISIGGGISFV